MTIFDPQINPQQAQSLADLMGGGTAGAYMGMQGAFQQDANMNRRELTLADLTKINQENELYKAKMPNEMLVSDAAGREASSKTAEHFGAVRAGERGQARSLMAKGDLDQATLQSNIDNTLSEHKSKALKRMGEDFTQVATYIGTLPLSEQGPAMQQIIASRPWGNNENMASAWTAFGRLPPDQMRAQLIKAGEFLSSADPSNIMQLIKEREGNTSREKVAGINASATRYAADSRKKDIDAERISTIQKEAAKGSPEALMMLSQIAEDEGKSDAAKQYKELAIKAALRREAEKRAGAIPAQETRSSLLQTPAPASNNPYVSRDAAPNRQMMLDELLKK